VTVRFSKLTKFPRNRLIEEDLLRCRASELDLLTTFGAPTLESPASEPDPTFYWDVEWVCGLLMSMHFNQLTERLTIRLNEVDGAHALRHLGFDVTDLWSLEQESPDVAAALRGPSDASWELWQQQGASGRVAIAVGLTKSDADCWCAEIAAEANAKPCWVQQTENALPHRR
jgi:hypothetical protein